MRHSAFFLIQSLLAFAICGVVFGDESSRTSKASSVSDDALERAIKDSRYFNRQFACLAGEGPCDQVGRRLKDHLPCAIKGVNCPKNTKDLRQINRVKGHLIKHHPQKWEALVKNSNKDESSKRS